MRGDNEACFSRNGKCFFIKGGKVPTFLLLPTPNQSLDQMSGLSGHTLHDPKKTWGFFDTTPSRNGILKTNTKILLSQLTRPLSLLPSFHLPAALTPHPPLPPPPPKKSYNNHIPSERRISFFPRMAATVNGFFCAFSSPPPIPSRKGKRERGNMIVPPRRRRHLIVF